MDEEIPILSNGINDGDVLVTSNMLISSALLIQKKISLTAGVLLDFCTLIKALTFHDRIIVLPAYTRGFEELQLFKYLKKRKILFSLGRDVSFALNNPLLGDLVGKEPSEEDIIREWGVPFQYTYWNGAAKWLTGLQNHIVDDIIANRQFNLKYLFDSDKDKESREFRYRLRTAMYYELSNQLGLPFIPDFTRIPILIDYDVKITESIDYD